MTTQKFTDGVTLSAASWFDDVDTATYSGLTSVSGTNTIAATGPASMTAYAVNQSFRFVPANTNTGATTLNITANSVSLGAKNVFWNGVALVGGELRATMPVLIVYDGTQFQIVGNAYHPTGVYGSRQVYTTAGANTWTKPAGLVRVEVTVIGGGAGSGGSANAANGLGGSGGGGGVSKKTIAAASLGATETATVGAKGVGGASGNNSGTSGGTSSFGAHCQATGGVLGAGSPGNAVAASGTGGLGSGGDINGAGTPGSLGSTGAPNGGIGGSSHLGGGGAPVQVTTNGNPGQGYGGGASGGTSAGGGTAAGADGTAGIIIVEEFF